MLPITRRERHVHRHSQPQPTQRVVASDIHCLHGRRMRGASDPWGEAPSSLQYLVKTCADAAIGRRPSTPLLRLEPHALLALSRRHRVATPVLARIADAARPSNPALADELTARIKQRSVEALRHSERLIVLSGALTAAGVRHMTVKGPVLAKQIYGSVTARYSKDLDLLVEPTSIKAVEVVLRRIGFEDRNLSGFGENKYSSKHRSFVGFGMEVEVHTRLLDVAAQLPLNFTEVWERRVEAKLGPLKLATLSPIDSLLYLCAHGASHLWFRLKWLEDIARIILHKDDAVLKDSLLVARRVGAEAVVAGALQLVEDVFEISPTGPLLVSSTWASRALVHLSKAAMLAPAELASAPPIGWLARKVPLQFGLGRGWRYYAELLRLLVLTRRDFDAVTLPDGWGWLRVPMRPAMLIWDRWRRAKSLS